MNTTIHEKIARLRKKHALTQEKLGEQLGVTSQAVSKWEKGESLPDILLLPRLCEVLGISVDALLEMPLSIKKEHALQKIADYAKESGTEKAIFDAFDCCVRSGDEKIVRGSALVSYDRIRAFDTGGIGVLIYGKDQIETILQTETKNIAELCELLSDENTLLLIRTMRFNRYVSEEEIMQKTGLNQPQVEGILFKLLRMNFCEYNAENQYSFGMHAYSLFTILTGVYMTTPAGQEGINSVCRNFVEEEFIKDSLPNEQHL